MIAILRPDQRLPLGAVLVDARTQAEYDFGHMPGAIHLAWEEWCAPAPPHAGEILAQPGYWGVLAETSPEVLGDKLAARGISSNRPLVVYAGGSRSRGRDGRIAWMLAYVGAREVYLLDGGLPAWLDRGGQTTTEPTRVGSATFHIDMQPHRRIDLHHLRRVLSGASPPVLVDTRSTEEYVGNADEYLPRRGHLPGALSLPFTELHDDDDCFLSREAYLDRLPEPARERSDIVAYCEVGVRAGTFALLHEVYTGQAVSVFDGSLMEWSLDRGLPLVLGIQADQSV
jgi:thiosulfate/3-mercaptopyruvate sulfurtransferase